MRSILGNFLDALQNWNKDCFSIVHNGYEFLGSMLILLKEKCMLYHNKSAIYFNFTDKPSIITILLNSYLRVRSKYRLL